MALCVITDFLGAHDCRVNESRGVREKRLRFRFRGEKAQRHARAFSENHRFVAPLA